MPQNFLHPALSNNTNCCKCQYNAKAAATNAHPWCNYWSAA